MPEIFEEIKTLWLNIFYHISDTKIHEKICPIFSIIMVIQAVAMASFKKVKGNEKFRY